ncbi:MAG: pilus assembly protein TadG-related protein [Pseudomonadota bacterium]
MKSTRVRHQSGQALPLALVLLAAVAATVFFMFNSGQLVQEKIRLTNTADAVAYSAGVMEARVLNYDAYTNRAIIANEIAIGQAVGLASWAKYAGTSASNISPWLYLIPYVGAVLAQIMDYIADIMDVITYLYAAAVTMHDGANYALKLSQYAVHGPANTIALASRWSVMREVARKNDPDVEVDMLPLSDDFMGFTQRYASKDERKRMGRVVNDSRDTFMRSRNWNLGLVILCTGAELRKRGSTELIDLTEGWSSMDTLSAHTYRLTFRWGRPRCRHSEIPIGYGKAYSDDGLDDSGVDFAGSRSTNPSASSSADSTIAEGFEPYTLAGGAIPEFYDLSESVLANAGADPRTTLAIRVSKPSVKQRFSGGSSQVKPTGRLALYDGAHARSESAAIARVEVFFERPDRNNNGHEEYGSLFNPYWQARLAPVSATQRAIAQLKQGLALP